MKRTLLGLLPVIGVWIYKVLIHPRPFWIVFYDPETLYFYNALRMATARWPLPLETPGTPVILLGVPLALVTGRTPLAFDAFRLLAYATVLAMTIAAAWLLARTILRDVHPLLGAVAIFTFFAAPQALEYFVIWSPEALFFVVGVIAAVAVWRQFVVSSRAAKTARDPVIQSALRPVARDPSPSSRLGMTHGRRSSFVAGLAIGLCIATKFTFVAWVPAHLLAMAVARRWREMPRAIAGYAVAFFAATIAILPNYPLIFARLFQFASRSGAYGSGEASVPSASSALTVLGGAIATAKVWHLWLLLVMIGAIIVARRRRELVPPLVFALAAIALTYATAIRYMPPRYILANGVSAAMLVAIASTIITRRAAIAAVCVLAAALGVKAISGDLRTHRERIAEGTAAHSAIHAALGHGVIVYGWRAPEPSFALRILSYDDRWLRAIETRYPNDGHYNQWHDGVVLPHGRTSWDWAVISDDDVSAFRGHPIVARVAGFNIIRR